MRKIMMKGSWIRSVLCAAAAVSLLACSSPQTKKGTGNPAEGAAKAEGTETAEVPEKKEPMSSKVNEPEEPAIKVKKVVLQETDEGTKGDIEDSIQDVLSGGSVDDGIDKLKDILSDDPKAFLAAYNLAILYDQAGRTSDARSNYQKALEIEPDFTPALINLVRLELRTGTLTEARSIADRHIAKRPDTVDHRLARLEVLLFEKRTDALIEESRSILKQDEANPRARYYMAAAHYRAGRYPLADFIVTQALDIDPKDPELHFLKGLVLLSLEEELTARDSFNEAVRLRPDYPEAQNAAGLMFYRARDFDRAEASFRVALKFNPDFKEAWLNLGNTLKAQDGRGVEAEAAYLKALELDPQWPDARFSLGALYLAYEVIPLTAFAGKPKDRLTRAKEELEHAKSLWNEETEQQLADAFIAKANKSLEIVIAEEELKMLEKQGGGSDPFGGGGEGDGGSGGDDPFGDGGGGGGDDPFGDDGGGGGGDDPFADGDGGGGDDPFGDDEPEEEEPKKDESKKDEPKEDGGDDPFDDGGDDPFDDGGDDPFE